jgi:hypothetical protein
MILYDADHLHRATNLARVLKEQTASLASLQGGHTIPPSPDQTLTIWGHGDPQTFAGLNAAGLHAIIQAWKTRNPKLNTVELVTCDARHIQDGQSSYSFTDQLMPLLIGGGRSSVLVKTLPRGGSKASWSRLWAMDLVGADGYYFAAGETEAAMIQGGQVMSEAFAKVPVSTPDVDKFITCLPIAQKLNDAAALKGPVAYVTSSGALAKLRGVLVPVTAYRDQVRGIVAVPKALD